MTTEDIPRGYRRTAVGAIPGEWDCERLASQCERITKGTTPTTLGRRYTNSGILFLKAESISEDGGVVAEKAGFIDEDTHALLARSALADGDILISIAGVLGRVGRISSRHLPANTNQALAIIRLREGARVSREFLFWCLRGGAVQDRIRDISVRAAQANISLKDVQEFVLPLPCSKDEQRAIATALSDADALIESLDRLIAKKRAIKQAAMQQLLTGEIRLPGFDGSWDNKNLGDLGTFYRGYGIKREHIRDEGVPCIRYGEIYTRYNNYTYELNSRISRHVADSAFPIQRGDLLFAGSGETAEEIGMCVAYLGEEEAYAGGDIVVLRPRFGNAEYLGHLLNHSSVVTQKMRLGQGDAVVHIGARSLGQVEVLLPPVAEQDAIARVLSDMDSEMDALERRREKARQVKQGMMQELLTGRTRLVEPYREAAEEVPA